MGRHYKYLIGFLSVVALLCISAAPKLVVLSNTDCTISNTTFVSGEKIVYKAYYNWQFVWIPAGEASFEIQEKNNSYIITIVGKTYESYDAFFRVRDYFRSEVDKTTMFPKNFVRIVEEGKYRKFDSISFNQDNLTAISFNGPDRKSAKKKVISLNQCTHDLISVLYFMRNIEIDKYTPGDHIPTKILFDETIYPIDVKYVGDYKDFKVKNFGKFNTIKVIPDLVSGNVFKDGNRMHVWVTNDGNKLPLLIESPLAFGSAKATIKSYSGLKYDMATIK